MASSTQHPDEPGAPTKSKNQLKNEAKKAEKMAKFMAKQEKQAESTSKAATTKPKTINLKSETVFEDRTVPGEKKGISGT